MNILKRSEVKDLLDIEQRPTKSSVTKLAMLRAAIALYPSERNLTLQVIADRSKVTRPLVKRYFQSIDQLYEIAFKLVRLELQDYVLSKLEGTRDPATLFGKYVAATLSWERDQTENARFLLCVLARITTNKRYKQMNSEWVEAGHERIQSMLLAMGVADNVKGRAHAIQSLLTGTLMSLLTQNHANPEDLKKAVREGCLQLATTPAKK